MEREAEVMERGDGERGRRWSEGGHGEGEQMKRGSRWRERVDGERGR